MALRITRADEPIEISRLNVVIYGPPGIGKSSLGFTADAPLLLDFDRGSYRAAHRGDTVQVSSWEDVARIEPADLQSYKTLVVDTAGRALDHLTADIIRRNPKAGRGGALTLQGYGALKSEFIAWLKSVNAIGLDVVLIAHMDEQRNGDDVIERLDVQGGSKGEIYKAADAMGRIVMRDGRRRLVFSPTDAAFGKDPAGLGALDVPTPYPGGSFLADTIERIKGALNAKSAAQIAAQAELASWVDRVAKAADAAAINAMVADVKQSSKAAQQLLANRAGALKLSWDKKANAYVSDAGAAK